MLTPEAIEWARNALNRAWTGFQVDSPVDAICDAALSSLGQREGVLEEAAKIAEKSRAVSRELAPEHWKCYEKEWGLRTLVANEIAENIRALSPPKGDA